MSYENEQAELNELHKLAAGELAADRGALTVWAGGDAPNQQDELIARFTRRFPDVPLRLTVDLSKYHDINVYQGILDGYMPADVVMLQTMHDFENLKVLDALEPFTPQSFGSLIPGYSDEDGFYLGVVINCFVPQYAKYGLKEIPSRYTDFLKPEYKNRLVLTPPHDDDAVLFVYDRIIKQYGTQFITRLAEQCPRFIRGTAAPAALVGRQGFLGNITGYMTLPDEPSVSFVPETDFFVTWPQRAAMFRLTRHKSAARLFIAYLISHEYQSSLSGWSVRGDVKPPQPLRPLNEYANTSPTDFIDWMRDRKHLHELRMLMEDNFGPVQGPSPLTDPALLRLYRR
jgi:ABC-type Fe3+ transport system substrate-binding protein